MPHKPIITMNLFTDKLKATLSGERFEVSDINKYINAAENAKLFCIERFSMFGKFGGQYTSHGYDHSARVLSFALQIAERLEPGLNAIELFYLGLAAILHDVGMTAPLPEDLLTDADYAKQWNERRERHGEATAKILLNINEHEISRIINSVNPDFYDFFPNICEAHCTSSFLKNIQQIKRKKTTRFVQHRFEILAGILLLADELDIVYHRAKIEKGHYQEFNSSLTKAHWWKHWGVANVMISNDTIRISHVSEAALPGAKELFSWTMAKINQQINLLKTNLGSDIWDYRFIFEETNEAHWLGNFKTVPREVLEKVQENRLMIQGQKMERIISPEVLVEKMDNKDATKSPSDFFREVIAKRISLFRGHGQYAELHTSRLIYVEEQKNMDLLKHAVSEWKQYVEALKNGQKKVRIKLFSGSIGVGKTHFLSAFLYEISKKDSYKNVLIVRSEFTQCERDNLLSLQRCVAYALFDDLHTRLRILDRIRVIMDRDYSSDVNPVVPKQRSEIESWDSSRITSFLNVIGGICHPEDKIHIELGEDAPVALCVFCDNSDQMTDSVIYDLYTWCNNISGSSNSVVWLFLRPVSISKIKQIALRRDEPFTPRGEEIINAPEIQRVIYKRIENFHREFGLREEIPVGNSITLVVDDCIKAIEYFSELMLNASNRDQTLVYLSKRLDGDGQANLRAALYMWINTLGSHIISNEDYQKAYMFKSEGKNPFELWPKAFEALLLGRRVWYSSSNSVVENLFDPPQISQYGDYFIIIHCLQVLLKHNNYRWFDFSDIYPCLARLGYDRGRISTILHHLSDRNEIYEKAFDLSFKHDSMLERTFPLLNYKNDDDTRNICDTTKIRITPWGKYHLEQLIYEFRVWKHIHYQITFPQSFIAKEKLDMDVVYGWSLDKLGQQLVKVINFLDAQERRWLYNISEEELKENNIYPVMEVIMKEVRNDISSAMSPRH